MATIVTDAQPTAVPATTATPAAAAAPVTATVAAADAVAAAFATQYWAESCSICFDRHCDFNFPHCQDQFCTSCIQQYLNEVISNSWGLSVCSVKCPVCYDVLPKHVWSKYVTRDMLARYERFNQPYRSFSRFCNGCGFEVQPTPAPSLASDGLNQTKLQISEILSSSKLNVNEEFKGLFNETAGAVERGSGTVAILFDLMLSQFIDLAAQNQKVATRSTRSATLAAAAAAAAAAAPLASAEDHHSEQPDKRRRVHAELDQEAVAHVMALIVSMERVPDKWRSLQHSFVRNFPRIKCGQCTMPMCLQCGESNWHEGQSCEEFSSMMLATSTLPEDARMTLQWKLANSKRCPTCSVMINREEGCNKVDCLHCGYEFCWICLQKWSKSCGFYKCATTPVQQDTQLDGAGSPVKVATASPPGGGEPSDDTAMETTTVPASLTSDGEVGAGTASAASSATSSPQHHDKPEIGVPNVTLIQRRVSLILEQPPLLGQRRAQQQQQQPFTQRPPPTPTMFRSLHLPLWKDWLLGFRLPHQPFF